MFEYLSNLWDVADSIGISAQAILWQKILFHKTWDRLTFPQFFSVSRCHGPQSQLLDLEASDRSASHSPTAQWSEQKDVCCYCIISHKEEWHRLSKWNTGGEKCCSSYFACFGKSFSNLAVASAVAGCDEVSDTAALQERGGGDGAICAEDLSEGNHLHQAETNHCRLSVVAESQTVTESCSHCDNVLQ